MYADWVPHSVSRSNLILGVEGDKHCDTMVGSPYLVAPIRVSFSPFTRSLGRMFHERSGYNDHCPLNLLYFSLPVEKSLNHHQTLGFIQELAEIAKPLSARRQSMDHSAQ